MSPLKGTSVPRSEINGLLIGSRLLHLTVKALDVKPGKITVCGDSECTIASLDKTGGLLAP